MSPCLLPGVKNSRGELTPAPRSPETSHSCPCPSDSFSINSLFLPGASRQGLSHPDSSPSHFLPISIRFPAESPVVPRRPVPSLGCLHAGVSQSSRSLRIFFFWKPCSTFVALLCPLQHIFQLIFSEETHYVIKQIVPLLP